MVVLDKTIVVEAPPDRVWRLLTRPALAPAWAPGVVGSVTRDGTRELAPGVVFTTVREDLGLRLQSEQETVTCDPPRRIEWRQRSGDFERNDGFFDLAPAPGGATRVRLRLLLELPFVLPRLLTDDAIRRHFSARFDDALLALKRHAEAPALALL